MSFLSQLIPNSLKQKVKVKLGVPNMFWSISNLKQNGFNPQQVIDIGAYTGEWTTEVLKIFPKANYLLVEPQESKRESLLTLTNKYSNIQYSDSLLSSILGNKVVFHEMETASSVLEEHYETNAKKTIKTTQTLDNLLKDKNIQNPDFIKLDTQGYELEILKGSSQALSQAEVVLMEVNLIDIHKNCPLLHEVINFMDRVDFIAYDICSFTRRPFDKALWQVDMLFVKKTSDLLKSKQYG